MKKLLTIALCAMLVISNVFSIPVKAGLGEDYGTLLGTQLAARCCTGPPAGIPFYYASSEATTSAKNLRIDIRYNVVGESGERTDTTGWDYDSWGTWLSNDPVPTNYLSSKHYVGSYTQSLWADAR